MSAQERKLVDGPVVRAKHFSIRRNGQMDKYPASRALPETEILSAMTYFLEHKGPAIHNRDDAVD